MLHRREFLKRTLQGSSLLALGGTVPGWVARTARAAEKGKEPILVLIELNGGNDGLNTVIPYEDDAYHKARPTLRFKKDQVIKLAGDLGLHPAMQRLGQMFENGQAAIVQGVGYPNPDRSHFESMDIWMTADPRRKTSTGWVGRTASTLDHSADVPIMNIGSRRLPLALQGGQGSVVTVSNGVAYRLELGTFDPRERKERKQLLLQLSEPRKESSNDLLDFVQRRQLETYSTVDRLEELLRRHSQNAGLSSFDGRRFYERGSLVEKTQLIARVIEANFGTRIFYVSQGSYDTHAMQFDDHRRLLGELSDAIGYLFASLKESGNDRRVLVMTFSEFGRRVGENGSKGTDHGSGSCLFVAGPAVKGGLVGKHPSLTDLDAGDLKYHTDFRRVYATVLDRWLGVSSRAILGGQFEPLDFLKAKA